MPAIFNSSKARSGSQPGSNFSSPNIPASKLYRYKADKFDVYRQPSALANGDTLDPRGRLITCEHQTRRVTRTEADGSVAPAATHFGGQRLNSPNDVVCKSDGAIYFSDPPYPVKPEVRELDFQGVYRVVEAAVPGGNPQRQSAEDSGRYTVALIARDFYIAAMKAVEIIEPTGQKLGEITLPERPPTPRLAMPTGRGHGVGLRG